MMRLDRRIRALERRYEARLNAAIECELARFTPEKQEELLRNFVADYERETGHAPGATDSYPGARYGRADRQRHGC
jgi:hypothetical protein